MLCAISHSWNKYPVFIPQFLPTTRKITQFLGILHTEESPPEYPWANDLAAAENGTAGSLKQIPLQRFAISEGSVDTACKGCFKLTQQRKAELTQALNTLWQFPHFGKVIYLKDICRVKGAQCKSEIKEFLLLHNSHISPENHLMLFRWEPTTIVILNIAVVWDRGSYNCRKAHKK